MSCRGIVVQTTTFVGQFTGGAGQAGKQVSTAAKRVGPGAGAGAGADWSVP